MEYGLLIIIGLIALAIGALAVLGQRKDPGRLGSDPGEGDHILESDYQSGVGGGNVTRWTVPKDPQAYAKRFVPRNKTK
ncbi:hypothetical protein [Roseovarius rhodophyticola]|uniref:Secreted protein n=1 Tax=Roseovarius rhodophyticola TaxID=3080827 RepID=A0ABZ2TES0_9RHOB|nr:hypothetical protein [Roseovarius sp. W115]MDV2928472.1 hypothetical protein [Roseovarius sp. W115]